MCLVSFVIYRVVIIQLFLDYYPLISKDLQVFPTTHDTLLVIMFMVYFYYLCVYTHLSSRAQAALPSPLPLPLPPPLPTNLPAPY